MAGLRGGACRRGGCVVAARILPDDAWRLIEPLLPRRAPSPHGGRPPIGDREALTGVLFILKTGIAWEDLPEELGCGCGMTCLRRLRTWQEIGVWPAVERILKEHVRAYGRLDWSRALRRELPGPMATNCVEPASEGDCASMGARLRQGA